MKIKKIPYYLAPWFLMAGASLTIGLLSFSGILAITPILPLAFGAFVLSVAYEGEIYLKNIKGSIKKLFKTDQLDRQLAKSCLREHCFRSASVKNRPQFFKDYEQQLRLLHRFAEKRLDEASQERKRHVEKTLGDMEKWFALQLFSKQDGSTDYQKELRQWLASTTVPLPDGRGLDSSDLSLLDAFQAKRNSRHVLYQWFKVFCFAAGVFMGLGTTYLLVEAFAVIPWLATLPAVSLPMLIVPMAAIAGAAYGFLVYNAVTDMIASEMVTTWFNKINHDLSNPKKWWAGVGKVSVLSVMFIITLALSLCTAGTWWTVAKSTPPLFSWMGRMPAFIMQVLNPLILSVSTWIFNVENVSETLEMAEPYVDRWTEEGSKPTDAVEPIQEKKPEVSTETAFQQWNPFRLFIRYVFDPLRKLLFLGHLASIGATADQVPGIPPILPAVLGATSEGVEDVHYLELSKDTPHEHKHDLQSLLNERLGTDSGHEHGNDLPTKCLTFLFSPMYFLAACWDVMFSPGHEKWDSWTAFAAAFEQSWNKETGTPEEETVEFSGVDLCCEKPVQASSGLFDITKKTKKPNVLPIQAWQFEQAAYRVERHKEKCLTGVWVGGDIAEQQIEKLSDLQNELYAQSDDALLGIPARVDAVVNAQLNEPKYNQHRFFIYEPSGKTDTREFLEGLPARVVMAG